MILLKVIFFPFWLLIVIFQTPKRRRHRKKEMELWGICYERNRLQLSDQEYLDDYSHMSWEKAKRQHKYDFCKSQYDTEEYYRRKDRRGGG